MADTSNLSNFLGDVADAIRTKKGTTETIPAANFDTEIASIETGSDISDATATANDILAGTTAYIADGKVEGNIQKIEEALDDTVVSNVYNTNNIFAYCKRHNLILLKSGYIKNIVTGETSSSKISLDYYRYGTFEFSYIDDANGNVLLYCITSEGEVYAQTICYTINPKTLLITTNGSSGRIYDLKYDSYANCLLPSFDDVSYCNLIGFYGTTVKICRINLNGTLTSLASHKLSATQNGDPRFIKSQYNLSKNKILIQCSTYINQDEYFLLVYDIDSNSISNVVSYEKTSSYAPYAWYTNDTIIRGSSIYNINDLSLVKSLSGMNYSSEGYTLHNLDTKLFVKILPSKEVVAQVIDYDTDNVISEQSIGYVDDFSYDYNKIRTYGNGVDIVYSLNKCFDIGIGAEKQITGLIRNGTQYNDTSRGNAKSGDILKGTTAYSSNGKLIGTMSNNGKLNITPSTEAQSIPAGYTSGGTVAGDSNLTANNIRLGTTIFGVEGNLEPDKPDQTKTATPTTEEQVITPDTGYELASVTVEAVTSDIDSNIVAENIKSGVTILGVDGSFEGGTQLPEGIFVQSDVPTKTTNEAIWLKQSAADDTPFLDKLPDEVLNASANISVRDMIALLTEAQKQEINSSSRHVIYSDYNNRLNIAFTMDSYDNASFGTQNDSASNLAQRNTKYYIYQDNAVYGYSHSGDTPSLGDTRALSNSSQRLYTDTPLYYYYGGVFYPDNIKFAQNIEFVTRTEEGINIVNGDTMTTVYMNKGTEFEKILDTSNADATAGDIVEGKTAFVNNTKITGTLTVPMSQEEYNTALSTANNILGEEVTE